MGLISQDIIESKIFQVKGIQIMLDSDLAELYQVETKVLNQAVKRNIERFPDSFRFQLTFEDIDTIKSQNLTSDRQRKASRSQFVTLNKGRGYNIKYPPVSIEQFNKAHDRFLILDDKELYHIGASLKDLGKKWFAFSRMDSFVNDVMLKLKKGGDDG